MGIQIEVSREQLEYISRLLTADEPAVRDNDELTYLAGCARDTLSEPDSPNTTLHGWCL